MCASFLDLSTSNTLDYPKRNLGVRDGGDLLKLRAVILLMDKY